MILIVINLEIVENKKVDKFFFRGKVEEFVLIEKI